MGSDEEWKKAAMVDDTVVAEMLLKLNQTTEKPSPPHPPTKPDFPLEWSVRQRRSKSVTVNTGKRVAPRASPTTPLSWSGGTSISGGGGGGGGSGSGGGIDGGSEESSKPQPSSHPNNKLAETTRSKVVSETTTGKRPRKKKTLAELKEEEIVLLKERRLLKRELTTLRVNFEKERVTNEKLKKMKVDVQSQMANERGMDVSTLGASDPLPVLPTIIPAHVASSQISPPESSCQGQKEATKFVLPDLNLPFEDDVSTKEP